MRGFHVALAHAERPGPKINQYKYLQDKVNAYVLPGSTQSKRQKQQSDSDDNKLGSR